MLILSNKLIVELFFESTASFKALLFGRLNKVYLTEEQAKMRKIPVAAVTPQELLIAPGFFLMDHKKQLAVLLHELEHVAQAHHLRQGDREHSLWNQATDYWINQKLLDHGHDLTDDSLYDPRYKGMAEEEIYLELLQQKQGSGRGSQEPLNGDLVPGDSEALADLEEMLIGTFMSLPADERGTAPEIIEMMIEEKRKPKIQWQSILAPYFEEFLTQEATFSRLNRRSTDDSTLPSYRGTEMRLGEIAIFWDWSGSISDEEIIQVNSEIAFMKGELDPQLLKVYLFDTDIRQEMTFQNFEPYSFSKGTGRGGTSFDCIKKKIDETQPKLAIIVTDMEAPDMGPVQGTHVVWLAINSDHKSKVGTTVRVNL